MGDDGGVDEAEKSCGLRDLMWPVKFSCFASGLIFLSVDESREHSL